MPTINEIKQEIAQKIAGQGSAVDAGSALPTILNGLVDAVASATANGYKFLGCYSWDSDDSDAPDVPIPDDGNYFILGYDLVAACYCIFCSDNGGWVQQENPFIFYRYDDAETIAENAGETDGFITPAGLVDYVAQHTPELFPTVEFSDYLYNEPEKQLNVTEYNNIYYALGLTARAQNVDHKLPRLTPDSKILSILASKDVGGAADTYNQITAVWGKCVWDSNCVDTVDNSYIFVVMCSKQGSPDIWLKVVAYEV